MGKHFEIEGRPYEDLTGRRFGKWTVLKRIFRKPDGEKYPIPMWLCRCDCGTEKMVAGGMLKRGASRSCGCNRKDHSRMKHFVVPSIPKETQPQEHIVYGKSLKRIKSIWRGMIKRCENPNHHRANRYSLRGIKVCKEWHDFDTFKEWALSNGYNDNLTIDRIDNDSGYCASNCRWITNQMQQNNRCNNHLITYKGETKTLKDWSRVIGIGYRCLLKRINELHWTVEDAFEIPTVANKSSIMRKFIGKDGQMALWEKL